jgi:hypothetical protein
VANTYDAVEVAQGYRERGPVRIREPQVPRHLVTPPNVGNSAAFSVQPEPVVPFTRKSRETCSPDSDMESY